MFEDSFLHSIPAKVQIEQVQDFIPGLCPNFAIFGPAVLDFITALQRTVCYCRLAAPRPAEDVDRAGSGKEED